MLDKWLFNHHFATDVFVADINGNGKKDFVVRHLTGTGKTVHAVRASLEQPLKENVMRADLAHWVLGSINLSIRDKSINWESDKIYLIFKNYEWEIPVEKITSCNPDLPKKKWFLCMGKAWLGSEKFSPKLAFIDDLFSNNPPTGVVKRFHNEPAFGLITISAEDSEHDYLIKVENNETADKICYVFVESGQRVRLELPFGTYRIKCVAGDQWYGLEELFGSQTRCFRVIKDFEIKKKKDKIRTYTLLLGTSGNLETKKINPASF